MKMANNNCKKFEDLFLDYINHKVSETDKDFCSEHWECCPDCSKNEDYLELINSWELLDKWQDIQPSKNFMAKLQREIAVIEERSRIFWFRVDRFFALAKAPLMAMIFAAITFTHDLSYASPVKEYQSFIEIKNKENAELKLRKVLNSSISDLLENIVNNTKEN